MIWPNYLSINDKQVCQWLTNFLVSSINDKQVCQWFDPIEWSPTTTSKLASEQWCAMMCQWFDPIICPSAAACGLLLQIQQATSCKCNGYYYHYHHAISLLLLWSMIWLLSSSTSTSLLTIKNTRIATATTLLTAYCLLPTAHQHCPFKCKQDWYCYHHLITQLLLWFGATTIAATATAIATITVSTAARCLLPAAQAIATTTAVADMDTAIATRGWFMNSTATAFVACCCCCHPLLKLVLPTAISILASSSPPHTHTEAAFANTTPVQASCVASCCHHSYY